MESAKERDKMALTPSSVFDVDEDSRRELFRYESAEGRVERSQHAVKGVSSLPRGACGRSYSSGPQAVNDEHDWVNTAKNMGKRRTRVKKESGRV